MVYEKETYEQLIRIADALEKANKLFIDFMAFRKAENIVRELKEEDLKVDTKVYDGLKVVNEVIPTKQDVFEITYDDKTFKNFKPCKYKCGYYVAFGQPYKEGDKALHINPVTREIIGYQCPKYAEEKH